MPLLFALSDPPMPLYPTSKKYWGMWAPKKRRVRRGNGGTKGREGKKRGQMELSRDSNLIHRASKRQWRRRRRNYLFGAASQWNEKKIFFSQYTTDLLYGKGRESMTFRIFCPLWNAYIFWGKCCMWVFFVKEVPTFLEALTFSLEIENVKPPPPPQEHQSISKWKRFSKYSKIERSLSPEQTFLEFLFLYFVESPSTEWLKGCQLRKNNGPKRKSFPFFFFPSSTSLCFPEKEEEHYSFVSSSSFQASHNGISLVLLLLWKGMWRMCCVRPVFFKWGKW